MRSLLHDVLDACPELIPLAFPVRWDQALSESQHFHPSKSTELELEEVFEAFEAIFNCETVRKTHRLCFFLDALDEYEGTLHYDFAYMVKLFNSWTSASGSTFKLCVSSREDNVFQYGFSADQRIRLQDLTKEDMAQYVHDKLRDVLEPVTRIRVNQNIVEKSDGIFLWVVLVVKALKENIDDGRDISLFEEELEALPTEMEELFRHLLDTIPSRQRRNGYRIFSMMLGLRWRHFSLVSCVFLDDFAQDFHFAEKPTLENTNWPRQNCSQSASFTAAQEAKAQRLVQGYCRGLVEVTKDSTPSFPGNTRANKCLHFTHRSVPEFLKRTDVQQKIEEQMENVHFQNAVSQFVLADLRCTNYLVAYTLMSMERLTYILGLGDHTWDHNLSFSFLDMIASLVFAIKTSPIQEYRQALENYDEFNRLRNRRGHYWKLHDLSSFSVHRTVTFGRVFIISPMFREAIIGRFAYIEWCLTQQPDMLANKNTRSLLVECLLTGLFGYYYEHFHPENVFSFLRPLLEAELPPHPETWPRFMLQVVFHHLWILTAREVWPAMKSALGRTIEIFLRRGDVTAMLAVELQYFIQPEDARKDRKIILSLRQEGSEIFEVVDGTKPLVIILSGEHTSLEDYLRNTGESRSSAKELIRAMNFENADSLERAMSRDHSAGWEPHSQEGTMVGYLAEGSCPATIPTAKDSSRGLSMSTLEGKTEEEGNEYDGSWRNVASLEPPDSTHSQRPFDWFYALASAIGMLNALAEQRLLPLLTSYSIDDCHPCCRHVDQ